MECILNTYFNYYTTLMSRKAIGTNVQHMDILPLQLQPHDVAHH